LHSPFKVFFVGFGSVDFPFWRLVAGLPESMRENQSSPDEKETQDSIGFDLEFEDLIRFGQMLELSLVPNPPRFSHSCKQRSELLLASKREAIEPLFGRHNPVRSDIKLDSECRTVIDQAG
jgi:hypothetical protein